MMQLPREFWSSLRKREWDLAYQLPNSLVSRQSLHKYYLTEPIKTPVKTLQNNSVTPF